MPLINNEKRYQQHRKQSIGNIIFYHGQAELAPCCEFILTLTPLFPVLNTPKPTWHFCFTTTTVSLIGKLIVFYIIKVSVIFQAEERVRRISSDLHCDILGLNGAERYKRNKKIKKTFSSRGSVEIPVVSHCRSYKKPYLHVHNIDMKNWISVSMTALCTPGACGYDRIHECSQSRQTEYNR